MNIETKIKTEVEKKNAIEFKMQDFMGKGSYAEVYSHDIENDCKRLSWNFFILWNEKIRHNVY